jgi:hypothetical protein
MKQFLLLAFLLIALFSHSQDYDYYQDEYLRYTNHTYKSTIQTVLLHKVGWELSYPIMALGSDEKLVLHFDDLSNQYAQLSYTIIHCTSDWKPSDILPTDYIEGYSTNQITDYRFSVGTVCKYIHYQVTIPNQDLRPLLSGNYILLVFEGFDQNKPVLTRRFSVVDENVSIRTEIKRASDPSIRSTCQEVNLEVLYKGLNPNDPLSQISVNIAQNNRWDNARLGLKPSFVDQNGLTFKYSAENIFPGGKEFRYFDIKSVRFKSERVERLENGNPYYTFTLTPDFIFNKNVYSYNEDLNGARLIKLESSNSSETDADYVWVNFRLPYSAPLSDGNVYVFGGLTDWLANKENRMTYNQQTKAYELTLLLKQGYYNYKYVSLKDADEAPDETSIEGSSSDAENDYLVYVYYRDPSLRYEQLIGLTIANSQKKY